MSYDQATNDELRDELRDRDLPVSGNKDELIKRLEEADQQDEGDDEGFEQATRDELRDELGDRDLPVSGNKDELIERLEEADQRDEGDDGGGANGSRDSERSKDSGESSRLKPMQLARLAGAQLMQLTGRDLDGTSGIEQTDEGWRVLLEVVEVTRVPRAMDVIGLYEVIVDDDGDLVRYERIRRYGRSQPEDRE